MFVAPLRGAFLFLLIPGVACPFKALAPGYLCEAALRPLAQGEQIMGNGKGNALGHNTEKIMQPVRLPEKLAHRVDLRKILCASPSLRLCVYVFGYVSRLFFLAGIAVPLTTFHIYDRILLLG